ncbi:helix-turn-helix domain-containing protein [Oceanobacillus manasiensis]|uniref:helix-turn-helix domain-containing protein n=1 Tax=Oceanobacillus manasiensis TaxID=586413 RepID=UPI0005A90311|nr:helix-turn-helix domain-containing protein [Oceanobacillus manasiensis]
MEIGARLKEAREAKNISLESLQESTKIQKRYLVAIEEGNMKILPGKFYARAFIKEYANAVGLDPDELLEEYKEEVPKTEEQEEVQYTRMQRTKRAGNSEKSNSNSSILPTIITIVLVIGILFAAWYFIQQSMGNNNSNNTQNEDDEEIIITNPENSQDNASENEEDQSNEDESSTGDDAEQEGSNAEEQEENQPDPTFSVVEEGTGSTPRSTVALDNAGEEVTATLEAENDTWLLVESEDGETFFQEGMFTSDQSPLEIDMSGKERIFFKIGNASHLTITINGVEMEYPVDANAKVRQDIWLEINQETE